MNWDDLKYFLAVSRKGSIRSAAASLDVSHATVARRIKAFEGSLGEPLFDRLAGGYSLTRVGEEIFKEATHLEETLSTIERRVAAKDDRLRGLIRVTLPDIIAYDLMLPAFAAFCELYPDVELEIIDSTKVFNLANREADVAFRICSEPPDYLVGRKLVVLHRACYMAKDKLPFLEEEGWLQKQNWLGWTDKLRRPKGRFAREYPRFASKHRILSGDLQVEACRLGMGIAILLCLSGDKHPDLVRVPPCTTEAKYDLWVLSHPDMRENVKVQTFVRYMTQYVLDKRSLIEGESVEYPSRV